MSTSTEGCAIDDLNALIALKSNVEASIVSQAAILRANDSTLDSPLTDRDGFPRADIDVWAVRHARVRIIRLRNDLSSLVDKIAIALERVYASQLPGPEMDAEIPLHPLLPFAKVDAVAPNSPAQLAVSYHPALSPNDFNVVKGATTWGSHHQIWPTGSGGYQWLPPAYRAAGGMQ